jgi:hypothetical protein
MCLGPGNEEVKKIDRENIDEGPVSRVTERNKESPQMNQENLSKQIIVEYKDMLFYPKKSFARTKKVQRIL